MKLSKLAQSIYTEFRSQWSFGRTPMTDSMAEEIAHLRNQNARLRAILDAVRTPNDYMVQIIFDAIYGRDAGPEDAVNALRAVIEAAEEAVGG